MRFVKASPSEYLVTCRNGVSRNHGTAGTAFVWPGTSCVLIPSSKQEATFEMTQETRDGIPMRFKGIIIYQVSDPVQVAGVFDFARGGGLKQIHALLSHVALGELRSVVANLTMDECILQRRTTLTDGVTKALREAVQGTTGQTRQPWGIELDVVQVAQVFIVDADLRKELEAVVRSELKASSTLAELAAAEKTERARVESERRAQLEALETERQRISIQKEGAKLRQQLEEEEIAARIPVEIMRASRQKDVLREELELRRLEGELKRIALDIDLSRQRAEQEIRKEILPLEQTPQIAQALSGVLKGARITLVGGDTLSIANAISPLVEHLCEAFTASRNVRPKKD